MADRTTGHGRNRQGRAGPGQGPFGASSPRAGRTGRGDVRTAILALLSENPQHGYQMIQQIRDRSDGLWWPSAGSIYPALQRLAAEGLVNAHRAGGRRVFRLTEAGERHADDRRGELDGVWAAVHERHDHGERDYRELGHQVITAMAQVGDSGSARQLVRAREILTATRTQLYQLLADGDEQA